MLRERVGVYVDQANINMSGGYDMDYSALRNFALRGQAQGVHLNVYSSFDVNKGEKDPSWKGRFMGYQSAIRQLGYHMRMKQAQVYESAEGDRYKANVDVDIAVDVMESASRLDRIVLVTGDGDFSSLIRGARRQGSRVEVIAFENCSELLRESADAVFPAWLIPGIDPGQKESGRIRGIIDEVSIQDTDLGMIRFLSDDLYDQQPLLPMAPDNCGYALFHQGEIPSHLAHMLKGAIVEFDPIESDLAEGAQVDAQAINIKILMMPTRSGWYKPYRAQ